MFSTQISTDRKQARELVVSLLSACLVYGAVAVLTGCSTGDRADPPPASPTGSAAGGATAGGGTAGAGTSGGAPTGGSITTFANGLTPTRELFVALGGSDATGDGSAGNPYATLGRAAQAAGPGTAIRLQPGTYAGGISIQGLAGTPAAPIWIGGVPGAQRPLIDGGNNAIQLSRARYVVVHDLEISGSTFNGINCDDGSQVNDPDATRYVSFERIAFRDVGTGGNNDMLKLSGLDDFFVFDCTFLRGSAGGSGIDMVGCHAGRIARCRFEQMGSNSVQAKGGSRDVEVRWCTFVDGGQRGVNIGGSTGDPYFRPPLSPAAPNVEATEIRVLGNTFFGGTTPWAFVGATNSVAAHNTVVNPSRWLLRVLQERTSGGGYTFTEVSNCSVLNNAFYFARGSVGSEVNVGPNTQPGTFTFQSNLYYAHDDPARSQPNLPAAETGTVLADPGFANVAGQDVSISVTSPARGAGAPQQLLVEDAAGNAYAPAPAIGAYEAP